MALEMARDFLKSQKLLTMATTSKKGIPNATPHEYGTDGSIIYLEITANHTAVQNIKENPVVHFEIHSVFSPDAPPKPGNNFVLQIFANCQILESSATNFENYWNKLLAEYPFMKMFPKETRVILIFTPVKGTLLEFGKRGMQRHSLEFTD
jgi:general stress protein 26